MSSRAHKGIVVEGHRIASGLSPTGKDGLNATVVQQQKFFIESGLPGAADYYAGTLNVNLQGYTFEITEPTHVVTCEWHPGIVETFYFVPVELEHGDMRHSGHIYFPLPSEVQNRNHEVVELLLPRIEGIQYGDEVVLHFPQKHVNVFLLI